MLFPPFQGQVFHRGAVGDDRQAYLDHAYQYATTSQPPGTMEPRFIVFVAGDDDIRMAIRYAADAGIAVAVRSGGHQYLGYSSTCGDNIQIDLSGVLADPATYPYNTFDYDPSTGVLRMGVGMILRDINARMRAAGLFVPHGECSHVRLGGHAQTGGYGLIANQFGLLADHITAFDIVLADGQKRTVNRDSTDPDDRELFFAVIGGSAGTIGVLTHVSCRPFRDADYAESRGMKLMYPYSKPLLEALLRHMVAQSDEGSLPSEYSWSIMAMGSQWTLFDSSFDEVMKERHPELYGEDTEAKLPIPGIAVVACWANAGGKPFGDEARRFFQGIRDAAASAPFPTGALCVPARCAGPDGDEVRFTEERPFPISWMLGQWQWNDVREFPLPFRKRLWLTAARDLGERDFAAWAAARVHALEADPLNGCKIAAQFMALGGRDSAFNRPPDDRTSTPDRKSTRLNSSHSSVSRMPSSA